MNKFWFAVLKKKYATRMKHNGRIDKKEECDSRCILVSNR